MLNVNTVDYRGSVCDGPGIRTVVFLQGCKRHCVCCHNPETWPLTTKTQISPEQLVKELARKAPTKRVTISGGEPLLQAEDVEELVRGLKSAGFDIALYTSLRRESVPNGIMQNIDYLKTGEYIDSLRTTVTPYVGSSNQLFERVA